MAGAAGPVGGAAAAAELLPDSAVNAPLNGHFAPAAAAAPLLLPAPLLLLLLSNAAAPTGTGLGAAGCCGDC